MDSIAIRAIGVLDQGNVTVYHQNVRVLSSVVNWYHIDPLITPLEVYGDRIS